MILIIICTFILSTHIVSCNLDERLKRYDLFSDHELKHNIEKRSTGDEDHKDMHFHSLGRDFNLDLVRHTSLFTKDFKVIAVDRNGERVVDFKPELYHGKLTGDPDSVAQVYIDQSGSFTSTISTNHNKYHFEPSWRYIPEGKNYSMIGYEEKDINLEKDLGQKFCQPMRPPGHEHEEHDNVDDDDDDDNNDNDDGDDDNNDNDDDDDDNNDNDEDDDNGESNSKNNNNNKESTNLNNKYNNHYSNNHYDNNHYNNNHHKNNHHNYNHHNNNHHNYNNPNKQQQDDNKKTRSKRGTSSCTKDNRMICTLMLVADYKFFVGMGKGDFHATTGYLISVIDQVNQIYKKQVFGKCGEGFQFEIREIRIHTEFSQPSDAIYAYNVDTYLNTSQLLEYFSRNPSYKQFCLAHLFTYTPYAGGILGLAYIGSPRIGSLGGVCSSSYTKDGHKLYINTGWSSSLNKFKRVLLAAEAYIVTAHELGHNWGSEHDVDNDECSPSSGKYIMYMYSVSGREDNNRKFSPCSRRSMAALIQGKAYYCFSEKSGSFCGNYKVEDDEECDEGPDDEGEMVGGEVVGRVVAGKKKCCHKCKLLTNSQCSDINHQCCKDCLFAPSITPCMNEKEFQCKTGSHCSGVNTTCEAASNSPDGSVCLSGGQCKAGKCLTVCEFNGQQPCICSKPEDSCKWCCRDSVPQDSPFSTQSTCLPFHHQRNLPAGTPCFQGFCDEQGTCQKQEVQNTIKRLWKIIENIDANKLVLFMRANIVGTVIVLSLLIWIPCSCLVSFIDRRRAKKESHEYQWRDPNNDQLLLPWDEDHQRPKIINREAFTRRPQQHT